MGLEIGLQVESYFLKPKYNLSSSNKARRILIFGDCVSQYYPLHLKKYLAQSNIHIDLYDDIIYHDVSTDLGVTRRELIKRVNPDLIISMNGLFEVSKKSLQYGFTPSGKSHETFLNLKLLSMIKKSYYDYLTREGQVRRIAQDYLLEGSLEKYQVLEDYLFSRSDHIDDNYRRAFNLWLFRLWESPFSREVMAQKVQKARGIYANAIENQQKQIVHLQKHSNSDQFKFLKNGLIASYWISLTLFFDNGDITEESRIKYFHDIVQKNDNVGFYLLEALHSHRLLPKMKTLSGQDFKHIENLLLDLAQKETLPINQMADKACEHFAKRPDSKLQCRLNVYDLSVSITELFELLKKSGTTPDQKKSYAKLREIYSLALPGYTFQGKDFNFDILPLNFDETRKYYDELVKFVKENDYPIIIAQYPTFYLPFLKDYNDPQNHVYVIDTPAVIKSSNKSPDYLSSLQPSIYNPGKLTYAGDAFFGKTLGDFILKNKLFENRK